MRTSGKKIAVLLIICLLVGAVGCGKNAVTPTPTGVSMPSPTQTVSTSPSPTQTVTSTPMPTQGTPDAEVTLTPTLTQEAGVSPISTPSQAPTTTPTPIEDEYVTIVLPTDFFEEEAVTQAELDALCAEKGYKAITLSDDGASATYVLTATQQEEMLAEITKSFDTILSTSAVGEDYPHFNKIEHNDDFTEFVITTTCSSTDDFDLNEMASVLGFYACAGYYSAVNGKEITNVNIKFVDEAGQVYGETNSAEMVAPTPEPTATEPPLPTTTNTPEPVATGTTEPTPTVAPTKAPTSTPSPVPTKAPTGTPSPVPTKAPTSTPSPVPTKAPTSTPSPVPTKAPTSTPSPVPTKAPTSTPSPVPTKAPTSTPSPAPTKAPTSTPSPVPTKAPTSTPSPVPTSTPTNTPTNSPSPAPVGNLGEKVEFSDTNVRIYTGASPYYETDTQDTVPELVSRIYELEGHNGSTGATIFVSNRQAVLDVAKKMASYHGIESVEVEETERYDNGSIYTIVVNCSASFRYHYAIETGDEAYLNAQDKQAIAVMRDLAEQAKQYKTDYEKEKFFHDYLVSTVAYETQDRDYMNTIGQTAYGALVMKRCVCNGYASAFEILLTMSGIECVTIIGVAGENHAWSQVKLDGEWYNVDVTWDDPIPDAPGRVLYTYFNVPDSFLYQTHIPTSKNVYKCSASKYVGVLKEYRVCSTQEEANAYAVEVVNGGNNDVTFVYTGTDEISINSLMRAVGKGLMYYPPQPVFEGKLYRITFNQ